MSRYLLDTGPLILHLRAHQPTIRFIRSIAAREQLYVTAITRSELRARMKPEERFVTNKLLSRFVTLPFDAAVADWAGDIMNGLRSQGLSVGLPDIMIAATAQVYDSTVITLNHKDFEAISGVRIYPWPNQE